MNTHQAKKRVIFSLVFILILAAIFYWILPYLLASPKSCDDIDTSLPELSFEMNYCSGAKCITATKEECETIDIVNSQLEARPDGQPDCMWQNNNCIPNK